MISYKKLVPFHDIHHSPFDQELRLVFHSKINKFYMQDMTSGLKRCQ